MKILIVESSLHYNVLENTYYLITNNCKEAEIYFYVNKSTLYAREALFPQYALAKWLVNPMHSCFFFFKLIFFGWKYKLINIATGPDSEHYSEILNVISFYIVSLLYGKKIILTIKGVRPYLASSPGIKSWIRNQATKHLLGLTFETNTMRQKFHEATKISMSKLSVSYDKYTDVNNLEFMPKRRPNSTEFSCIIGLTGVVEEIRRNYFDIIDAIKNIPEEKRRKLLFVTLGYVPDGANNKIIKEFQKLTNIDFTEEWLTAKEFLTRGCGCDLLISPLVSNYEYGTYKGSGSFGDSLVLRKKIILPSYVDPEQEFKDISFYYNSKDTLQKIFENIETYVNTRIPDQCLQQYSTTTVFNNIKNELQLSTFSQCKRT